MLAMACLGAGCTYYMPLQIADTNRPTKMAGPGGVAVKGESCQNFVLGIPLGKGNTLREALDNAKANSAAETLTDVTVDTSMLLFYPLFFRSCTHVEGVPVRG